MRPWLGAAIAVFGFTAIAAAQTRVLPPGLEDEVSAMVFAEEGAPDPAHTDGARIERSHIDVTIADGEHRGRVRLVARGETSDGVRVGDTASFTLWLIEGADDPAVVRSARALHARVRAGDDGEFFEVHAVAPQQADRGHRAPLPPWLRAVRVARAALWIALLVVLGLFARRARFARADVSAALILFSGALVLRLLLPWAPLHANDHGISEMRGLIGDPDGYEAGIYGTAYLDFVRVVLAPFGRWADGPFVVAAIFGALAAALSYALARALAGDARRRFGALAVGIAVAAHPMLARLSLSESPRPLADALWLLGLALCVHALSTPRAVASLAWIGAAIAWALAAELRVLTVLLPVAGLLFCVVARGRWRARPSIGVAVAMLAVLAAVAFAHAHVLRSAFSAASERPFVWSAILWRGIHPDSSVMFDPTFTPWLLLPILLVCAVRLWIVGDARLVIASVSTFAILFVPSLFVWACRTDAIRYQADTFLPLMILLVGLPDPERVAALRDRAPWVLLPAALIASAVPGWLDALRPDVHMQAYAIARTQAPPPPTPIRVAAPEMGDQRMRTDFPDYAIAQPTRVSTGAQPGCVAWIGVSCWSFTDREASGGIFVEDGAPLRAECAEMLGGEAAARDALRSLTPIDVPHRDTEFFHILAPRPRVGFAACPELESPP